MAFRENSQDVIESICEGGFGSEARIYMELRAGFPGFGGRIKTIEGAVVALRVNHDPFPGSGQEMFFRHVLIKKIDDYFYRSGLYVYPHIPRPFGSLSEQGGKPREGYIYEWVYGREGFPLRIVEYGAGKRTVMIKDWAQFVDGFHEAGINMGHDITDPDDADISKNIIHMAPNAYSNPPELGSIWKRIDFGSRSVLIDFEKLNRFLAGNRKHMREILRYERYEMMQLIARYLTSGARAIKDYERGRLEMMVTDYRQSSLRHYTSRGASNKPVMLDEIAASPELSYTT